MRASPSNLVTSVLHSVEQVPYGDWTRLYGDHSEGYGFFKTLEESGLEGFHFAYVSVRAGVTLELLAPVFWSELDLTIGTAGLAKRIVRQVRKIIPRCLILQTLFCGSPFGERGVIGIATGSRNGPELIAELVRAMNRLCGEKKLQLMLFKDFPAESAPLLAPLIRKGFFRDTSFPNVVLPLPFASLDEYLATLSYGRRKDLRRKMKKAVAGGLIEVRMVECLAESLDAVYQLYLQTYNAGSVRFEKLTPQFFINLSRNLPGRVIYFLFSRNGKLICFNLCLREGDTLIDKFIGMDYSVARELNLYFYTWCHNVEWCIRNKIARYQVGQTDYDAKLRLGGKIQPLYFYARHINPFINFTMRAATRFFAHSS